MVKRLALYGGTFDPVHMGHLLVAETAVTLFQLDHLYFLPAYEPPHKTGRSNHAADRLAMLKLAIEGNPHFALDLREMDSQQKCYSYDTVRSILAEEPDRRIYFIVGEDSFMEIESWYHWADLLALVHLIVACRSQVPGDPEKKRQLLCARGFEISLMERFTTAISSSEIRSELAKGHSIRYAVPDVVAEYIEKRGLYQA